MDTENTTLNNEAPVDDTTTAPVDENTDTGAQLAATPEGDVENVEETQPEANYDAPAGDLDTTTQPEPEV